jgi:hypothetical protein
VTSSPTDAALRSLYTELLECARSQVAAVEADDWTAFARLLNRRKAILSEGDQILEADRPSDPSSFSALITSVQDADAILTHSLATRREELSGQIAQFSRERQAGLSYLASARGYREEVLTALSA